MKEEPLWLIVSLHGQLTPLYSCLYQTKKNHGRRAWGWGRCCLLHGNQESKRKMARQGIPTKDTCPTATSSNQAPSSTFYYFPTAYSKFELINRLNHWLDQNSCDQNISWNTHTHSQTCASLM